MVRKKIENINFITDKNNRHNTFQKRKRGFFKKAIEFCNLCGLDIYIAIHDKEKNKLIEFRSDNEFKVNKVRELVKNRSKMTYEKYDNSDYWEFVPKDQKKELKEEGKLPSNVDTKVPKNHTISEMSSLDHQDDTPINPLLGKRSFRCL
jgi:hypothetical protein